MTTKTIKIIDFYRTADYDKNYERNCGDDVELCECCGRKLNPKTMKMVQAIEPGYMTDETEDLGFHPEYKNRQVSMGFYPVGPKCYREIMRMCRESNNKMEVTL